MRRTHIGFGIVALALATGLTLTACQKREAADEVSPAQPPKAVEEATPKAVESAPPKVEQETTIEQVPPLIQKSIRDHTPYSVVDKIVRVVEDGQESYRVLTLFKDRKIWLEIGPDGKLLSEQLQQETK